jgi:branched-chain amino acid transport system substrate-binding protein
MTHLPTKPIALAVAALFSCAAHAQTVTVKIGHVAPMTGGIAHLGKDNEAGAKLAIADLNKSNIKIGGKAVKFELLSEDDGADPKQGTAAAQKLVDAKVAGVVGHLNSGTTIPASKIYSDAGIPQISPSATNPKYTLQGFKTAFRVVANDSQLGGTLGRYASSMTVPPMAKVWPMSSPRACRRLAARLLAASTPPTRPPTSWPS